MEYALAQVELDAHGNPFIAQVDEARLRHRLVRSAFWRKRDGEGGLSVPARPPHDLARDMLARPTPPLRVLEGLRSAPYITVSGELRLERGYDSAGHLYYVAPAPLDLPAISPHPSPADVADAVSVILEPLADFPFVTQAERAHALGLMFLPFVEQRIAGPLPAHVIDKPVPAAGAGLLTDVVLWPALGQPAAKMTEGQDEDEWRKRITAKLLQGSLVIGVDNVRHRLDSAALASALTETFVEDRVLGHSRVARVVARRIWVLTGNNIQMSDEIRRRAIRIRLDPGVERPELRTGFRHPDLRAWVALHRLEMLRAILTICQGWLVAGCPQGKRSRVLGSFEAWAGVVGGILDFAAIPGFLDNREDVRATADLRELAWKEFLGHWWTDFKDQWVGVSDLWTMLEANPDALAALDLGDGRVHALKSRLGLQLAAMRDRVFDGRRLDGPRSVQGANRWRLVSVM